jgi:autotransporter-associated beta strand protein
MKTVKILHATTAIKFSSLLLAFVFILIATSSALAQETWSGGTSGSWNLSSNWSGGIPASTDTATFNNNVNTTIDLGASGATTSVKSITFDTAGVGAFTIGATTSGTLALATGGTIQTTSSVANIETINAPITLAGGYTFSSNSSNAADTLNFGGTIRSLASNTITLAGSNTGTNTISGAISGASTTALTKTGAGTWVLTGANTYTGNTSVSGGTLILNANTGSLTSGNNIGLSGGAFVYTASDGVAHTPTFGTVSSSAGANTFEVDETGAGSVTGTIANATRTVGNTLNIVTTGSVTLVDTTALSSSDGIFYNGADYATNGNVANGVLRALNYGVDTNTSTFTTNNTTVSGGSAGVGYLISGTVTTMGFSGTNSSTLKIASSNNVTINSASGWVNGIIVAGGHTDTINGSAGSFKIGASVDLVINTVTANDKLILNAPLGSFNSGTVGAVTKTGAGVLVLAGASTYSGNTSIVSGTVQVTNAGGLGYGLETASTSYVVGTTSVATGATLDLSAGVGGLTVNEPVVLNGATLTNSGTSTATIDNGIAGVQFSNLGTGSATAVTASFGGTGSGATATIALTSGAISSFTLNSGGTGYTGSTPITFNYTGSETTTATATAILSSVSLNGVNTVAGTGNLAINAVVSGTGGLSKSGTNTLTLAGANTYSGGTTVTSGTLAVTNTSGSATGSGALTLNSGATLAGNGAINSTTNAINGNVTVGNGGTDTTSFLTMTATGTTTITNATLAFNLDSTSTNSNKLAVGSSNAVVFGTGNTLALNITGASVVANSTQYELFNSTVTGSGVGNSIFGGSGISYNSGTGVITGLTLNLVLVADGPGYDIDLDVQGVPEPSTYAMFLGGLALLIVFQRSRRQKN